MQGIINKRGLFCDENRAVDLCEYQKELSLIKQLIKIIADTVDQQAPANPWSHDGICHMFAKSIVDYLKMAYDNMLLGHFYATQMVFRTIVENHVCLCIIQQYREHELWKYYMIHSFYQALKSAASTIEEHQQNDFNALCRELGVSEEFMEKRKKQDQKDPSAYVDKKYGWTYKINKEFSFNGLCKLVDPREYSEFKYMSMYSHGTSIYLKICESASMDHIMNTISFFYYVIVRLVSKYYSESVTQDFTD